jgi:TolB-like protein
MKLFLGVLATATVMCLCGGCATSAVSEGNGTDGSASAVSQTTPPPVGNFNERMKNLANQLHANASAATLTNTYIVTSFTNLDKLGDTTALGRLISENLMHGLQRHKWQILELRLTKGVDINTEGEFSLSRDINKLKDEYKISGIVTGTYSAAEGNLTINARVIDVNTGIVISSAQTYIPLAWLLEIPSQNQSSPTTMRIVNDGIK